MRETGPNLTGPVEYKRLEGASATLSLRMSLMMGLWMMMGMCTFYLNRASRIWPILPRWLRGWIFFFTINFSMVVPKGAGGYARSGLAQFPWWGAARETGPNLTGPTQPLAYSASVTPLNSLVNRLRIQLLVLSWPLGLSC